MGRTAGRLAATGPRVHIYILTITPMRQPNHVYRMRSVALRSPSSRLSSRRPQRTRSARARVPVPSARRRPPRSAGVATSSGWGGPCPKGWCASASQSWARKSSTTAASRTGGPASQGREAMVEAMQGMKAMGGANNDGGAPGGGCKMMRTGRDRSERAINHPYITQRDPPYQPNARSKQSILHPRTRRLTHGNAYTGMLCKNCSKLFFW